MPAVFVAHGWRVSADLKGRSRISANGRTRKYRVDYGKKTRAENDRRREIDHSTRV
jgi:hypothetical protein